MLCGSREDAEDVTQEAFLEAFRSWDRIAGYDPHRTPPRTAARRPRGGSTPTTRRSDRPW
ncbi:sigma factor [Streptomyces sp. NPDC088196]|uniref:sigma factor n=1 Tax=Streptomyces sp. NPDC088196 TaxID=3154868 RepID=UPI00344BD0E0